MEAIKTKGVAHKGVLSIPVPKEFDERELEVIILSPAPAGIHNETVGDEEVHKHEEKVGRLMSIVGAAKFPKFPITKYDVYEQ
ncbi:MAG: hypothetical protein JWQ09_1023 [Segetibacter sp.]|nr:hypothetical protein [Segetibacter sp.]